MPLVYVHGIANRRNTAHDAATKLRDQLFREVLLDRVSGTGDHMVLSPFWGDFAGSLRWNWRSFPISGTAQSLGGDDETLELVHHVADGQVPDKAVLAVAKVSLEDAIDLVYTLAITEDTTLPADELAVLGSRLLAYTAAVATGEITVDWITEARDDEDFLDRLVADVDTRFPGTAAEPDIPMAMGAVGRAWAALRRGVVRLKRMAVSAAISPAVRAGRALSMRRVPLLLGDVTAYLAQRGTAQNPGPIVRTVVADLERAAASGGPLIVIAHSMGGNIVYDVLTHFRPDLRVDFLVTVGSQVGLFEELKLFGASRPDIPGTGGERVPMPLV